jgi:hypothetical protein
MNFSGCRKGTMFLRDVPAKEKRKENEQGMNLFSTR